MGFVDLLKERAKKSIKTIVLPETEDMRTIEATDKILKEGVAKIILIGNEEEINKKAAEGGFDISGATIVDPETSDRTQAYIDKFVELRAKKGMTPEKAKEILHTQYPYYGVMMVKMGDADGMVSGACHSTADTLRPCLQILKTKPGTKLVSAFFLIVVPDCEYGANGAFVFADSGLNQNPTPEELSAIAASSAESFQLLVQEEPVVAMLSHSTKGSAKHPDVDKMVEATRIAKEEHPELKLDGEFQLDAAIVPSVGASKAPGSEVAGKANVLVFPDLDAGNIGYKLAQRLGKAEAYGPVTQCTGTTGKSNAAKNDTCDDVHFHSKHIRRMHLLHHADTTDTTRRCNHTYNNIHDKFCSFYIKSSCVCTLWISADCVNTTSKDRIMQYKMHNCTYKNQNNEGIRKNGSQPIRLISCCQECSGTKAFHSRRNDRKLICS